MWLACQDLGSPNPRSPGRGEGWSKRNLFVVHLLRDIQLDFSEELSLRKNVVFGILKIFPSMKQPLHRYSLREAAHDLQALKQQDVHLSSARYLLWRVRVYSCGRSYCMSTVTSGWPGASASASARRSGLAGIANAANRGGADCRLSMAKPPLQTVAWLCRPAEMWRRGSSKGPPGPPESRSHTRTSIAQRHMMSRCSVSDAVVVVGLCLCERVKSRRVKCEVHASRGRNPGDALGLWRDLYSCTKGTFGTMQKVGIRDLTKCKQ
jgi:hypothetical protein